MYNIIYMEEHNVINNIKLELGDIIELRAPTNLSLHENNYYIELKN